MMYRIKMCTLLKNPPRQVLSSEFFKNTSFTEHVQPNTFVFFILIELKKIFSMFVNVQKDNTILKRVIECTVHTPRVQIVCSKSDILWSSCSVIYSPTARNMHPRSNYFVYSHPVSKRSSIQINLGKDSDVFRTFKGVFRIFTNI